MSFLDYAVLSEKAAAASAHFNELSARIKAAEKRMAEIAVLREHIVGYAKTRDTYVAYRKAGYSKKFLAEHESEITIHKAAKNYFDGLGFKKLPTIKALNTEYAELLAEKKAAYADYRKAREEMKELLTAKANIDRILELDKEQEEANERREKRRSSAELPAHKRFEKSRSRWIYPSFQNTVFVFCGDWGSAPTSMKQAGSV